jgi:hypothetical protein
MKSRQTVLDAQPTSAPDPDESDPGPPPVAEAPEVPAGMEEVATWDEPPAAAGIRVPRLRPDDEELTSELVSEGIEEADRELRLEANTESEDEPAETDTDYPREGILS